MTANTTAKIFTTGNSQAVRLPKAFRMQGDEVWISKNELTGEIVLRPKEAEADRLQRIERLMRLIEAQPFPADFIPPRSDAFAPDPLLTESSDSKVSRSGKA
jgi:antitoxin VapB